MANLALLDQTIQRREKFRMVVNLRGWTVQLQEVERVSFKILQTAIDKGAQVLAVISGRNVRFQPPPCFGRDDYLFAPFALEPRQQTLTAPVAVNIGGIEKVHAQIQGPMQGRERFPIVDIAPRASDGPGAKTNLGNLPAGSA